MGWTKIQSATMSSTIRIVATNMGKSAINYLFASGMVTPSRDAVSDVSFPIIIKSYFPAHSRPLILSHSICLQIPHVVWTNEQEYSLTIMCGHLLTILGSPHSLVWVCMGGSIFLAGEDWKPMPIKSPKIKSIKIPLSRLRCFLGSGNKLHLLCVKLVTEVF